MSYGIESKKLKRLVNYYSPYNSGEQIKYLSLFNGEEGLLRYLQTSPFQGIDQTSIQQRVHWFGSNQPVQCKKNQSLLKVLLSPLQYFIIKLYLGFSLISLITYLIDSKSSTPLSWLGSVFNVFLFIFAYILLVIPAIYQYYDNLHIKKMASPGHNVKVWRDNQKKIIHSYQLVVGDVVELQKGDIVSADGLIIQNSITVKQLLGHKQLVLQKKKTKQCIKKWAQSQQILMNYCTDDEQVSLPSPIVIGGSQILSGEARMVVLSVGKFSRAGSFIYQVHRSAIQKKSDVEKKIEQVSFQVSKYLILAIICFFLLYCCKVLAFLIIQHKFTQADWYTIFVDLGKGISIILMGMPAFQILGLAIGMFCLKIKIYKEDKIWFKYAKDCGQMKQTTSVLFEKIQQTTPIRLLNWWNKEEQKVGGKKKMPTSVKFQNMFIKSLKCPNLQPFQVGLKLPSFFVGMSPRILYYLQQALNQFANQRSASLKQIQKNVIDDEPNKQFSEIDFQNGNEKQIQIIYLKGNSQALFQQCTHLMDRQTNIVIPISQQMRQSISAIILSMNEEQKPSLITGYIQVHPNHPKFREPDYKVVMLSLLCYVQKYENQQFDALHSMRKNGISFTLLGNRNHEETIALAQQIGIVMLDKPSIRLRGYDFNKIVGGMICKTCKKSLCMCNSEEKYLPILNNQDEFNRICKHLNVISQASPIEKMTLAIGLASANENVCFFGSSIHDVPAMRCSSLAATVRNQMHDSQVLAATQVVLPDNRFNTLQRLIMWSQIFFMFCRKYVAFTIVPCSVAFISSSISFLLFNSLCISLIQLLWVVAVMCPILGAAFVATKLPCSQSAYDLKSSKQSILDKVSYRHINSQIIAQVALILIVLFFGHTFIPQQLDEVDKIIGNNWNAKYHNENMNTICKGIYTDIFNNLQPVYSVTLETYHIYSRHYTFIFNLFTIMQFINYFNYKNLGQNGFDFTSLINIPTLVCLCVSVTLHQLVLLFGNQIFQIYPGGLTFKQWAICLGMALVVVLIAILTRQVPFENEKQENNMKIWPNRCYNLAVMATVSRDTLQDFQNDEEMDMRKIASRND